MLVLGCKSPATPASARYLTGITKKLERCASVILKLTRGLKENICLECGLNEVWCYLWNQKPKHLEVSMWAALVLNAFPWRWAGWDKPGKEGRGAWWASWEGWQAESMGQQQFWGPLQVQGTPEEHPCTIPLQNCSSLADHGLRCFLLTESIALTVPQEWLSFSPSLCFCSTPSTIISPFHGHSTPGASCWMGWCLPRAAGMTGEGVLLQTLTVSFWEQDKKWEKHVTVS